MKLKQLGANQSLLFTNHGDEILYSYGTPVAGYSKSLSSYWKDRKFYSNTTSRHVNKYIPEGMHPILLISEQIENMFL